MIHGSRRAARIAMQHPQALDTILRASLASTLLKLALPNLTPFIAVAVLVSVDAVVVARLGREALAGLSLVFPLVMLSQTMAAGGLGSAVAASISAHVSAGRYDRARVLALHGLLIALTASGVIALATLFFAEPALAALGADGEIAPYALAYGTPLFLGSAAPWAFNVAASIARGLGDMKRPALAMAISTVLYASLCPLAALGISSVPGLGIAGAALAFVVSYAVGAVPILVSVFCATGVLGIRSQAFSLDVSALRELLTMATLTAMNPVLSSLTVMAVTSFVAHVAPAALAGFGLGVRVEYLVIPLAFSVGTALVTVVGAHVGAGDFRRAKRAAWIGACMAASATGLVGGLAAVFPELWLRRFTDDADVIAWGVMYLRTVSGFYGCFGFGLALHFALVGGGRAFVGVVANLVRLTLILVGLHYFASGFQEGCIVVAIAFTAYAIATACGATLESWKRQTDAVHTT